MTKLQALTAYLSKKLKLKTGQIDSWIDQSNIQPVTNVCGEYVELCRYKSECTVFIEAFNGDAHLLLAELSVWLHANDSQRADYQLPEPEMDITPLDSGRHRCPRFDIEISITFIESVLIKPDEHGLIDWQGKRWSLIDAPLVTTATDVHGVGS